MSEVWMTYPNLAQHWGMSVDAARTRARRGHFQRRVNNLGQAEVLVDAEAPAMRVRPPRAGRQTQTAATLTAPAMEGPPAATAGALEAIAALEAHVGTLREQLGKVEAIAAERGREAAAAHEQLAKLSAEMLRITADLLEVRKAEATPPRRSWWKRLAG